MLRASLLGALTVAILGGCGASIKARDGSDESSASSGAGLECGMFTSATNTLSGKITTYYRAGILQEDRVRVRLTSAPAALTQTQAGSLQFFRWSSPVTGAANLDSTPLSFVIETPEGIALSNSMSSLNLATLGQIKANAGMGNASVQDFLNAVVINVSGTDYLWNALKVSVYQDGAAVAQADGLLPVYAANPNTYATTHSLTLSQLHPFWAQRAQSLDDAAWITRSKSYCF